MHTGFIENKIFPNFKHISTCHLSNDNNWKFQYTNSYIAKEDIFNWIYVFLVKRNNIIELVKIGGTGSSNGMASRMKSYLSGNPKYNENNGPQNRACYLNILTLLQNGADIQLWGYQIPSLNVVLNLDMPWDLDNVASPLDIQVYKPYEKNLISIFESTFGQKPIWNRYAN